VPQGVIQFDEFALDCDRYELLRAGIPVKLERLPMELLILLVEKGGYLVTRKEIVERLWGDGVFLDTEHGINTAIRKLRNALRDNPEQSRLVETVTGKGYRFIAATMTVPRGHRNGNNGRAGPASTDTAPAESGPGEQMQGDIHPSKPVAQFAPRATARQRRSKPLLFAAAILVVAAASFSIWKLWPRSVIESVAVLPFTADDPSLQYLGDGIAETLTDSLSQVPKLHVLSRNSVFQVRAAQLSARDLARRLGVRALVMGSVKRRDDGTVHLSVELLDGPEDRHIWSGEYTVSAAQLASAQPHIAQDVFLALRYRLDAVQRSRLGHRYTSNPEEPDTGKLMLTVLPFENLGGDSEEDYFSDGLTEEVITQLASLDPPRLGVIARNSAMQYRGTSKDARQIGGELGVDYILQGTVRRGGGRTRVTVQLVQASDQTHLWAHSYEGDLRDVLALQSDIAQAIADQIHLRLGPAGSGKLGKAFHVDPAAYEAYLKGRYFWNKYTVEGSKKSIEYFQEATAKDPGFAQAYAGLAAGYGILAAFCYLPSREAYPPSKAAAKKALEIDEMQSEAHTQLGFVNMFYEHDWPGTEREFRRAIELNPSNAIAHDGLATYFLIQSKFDDALAEMERAKQLDPVSLNIKADRGWYLFFARRPDQAIAELQTTLELDPSFGVAHSDLGHAYEQKAMYGQAIREFQTAVAASGSHTCRLGAMGHAYAVAGQRDAANQVLEQLQQMSLHRYVSPYHTALILAGLGEKDQALSYLEKAYDERFWMIAFLGVDPRLDGLRSAPRFQKLMRRLAFPPPS
jgi:TolB-like protein/DNA-binding winged helix-turn-helix (wHTH) protein/Tfp pilus assembly protein PilF